MTSKEAFIVKAIEQAMNNLYEAKVSYSKGSYEDPYLFVCSKKTAKIIKRTFKVDENNIFLNGCYYQLGIQKPLKSAKLRSELEND